MRNKTGILGGRVRRFISEREFRVPDSEMMRHFARGVVWFEGDKRAPVTIETEEVEVRHSGVLRWMPPQMRTAALVRFEPPLMLSDKAGVIVGSRRFGEARFWVEDESLIEQEAGRVALAWRDRVSRSMGEELTIEARGGVPGCGDCGAFDCGPYGCRCPGFLS